MSDENGRYILTEIWNAKPAWMALSKEEREAFFDQKVGPFLMKMLGEGAQILGTAVNNNDGSERMEYRYMAVWSLPDKDFSDRLEGGAKELGFLDYFEQVNFSGNLIPPPSLNQDMIDLT